MEALIFIVVAAIIFLVIKARQGTDGNTSPIRTPIKKEYVYIKKSCAMTPQVNYRFTKHYTKQ